MADKHIWEIESASTMRDEDRLLIVVGTSEFLINKSDFKKALGGLSSVDTTKLSKIIIDGDGSRVLANNGEYISLNDLYEDKHNHSNKTILDKFTVDSETGKLLYDGVIIGSDYELPIATSDTLGGVKVDGNTITIDENGVISGANTYILPTATTSVLGGVKPDGTTITVDENGVISGASTYELPKATTTNLGGVKVDGTTITVNSDGIITCINEGSVIATWASNVEYPVGCVIVYETTLYKCLETHTSGDAFDNTKWQGLTGEKGDKGEAGTNGTNGISPTVTTTQTETGATISVTDASGTTTSVLTNGVDGVTPHIDETTKHWMVGETDTNIVAEGKDGTSPTATITKTDTGATITVVSGEQTTVAELTNGATPEIDETTKHWIVNGEDTGVVAEGSVEINADCAVLYGTFVADGWSDTAPYTQTVTVNNIAADNTPIVDISYSADTSLWDSERKAYNCLTKMETIDGGIVAYCLDSKPESDFTVKLRIAGDITGLTFVTKDEFDKLINTNYTGTLLAADWVGDTVPYTQTLNIEGLSTNLHPILDLVVSDDTTIGLSEIEEWGYISTATVSDNSITIACYESKPTLDLNIVIKVV